MQCTSPFHIKNPDRFKYKKPNEIVGDEWLSVPCGHCMGCRIARTREWTIRLLHESEFWEDTLFITLTYRDDDLPENNSLCPRDLTLFFKRLRKDLGNRKIKYYACGEYGDLFGRPHFHAIVFGLSANDKELIEQNWTKGFVKIGSVTYDSCRYVCGYVQKKLYGKGAKEYEDRGLIAPFSRMSKHLGESYVDKYYNKLWNQETVTVRGVPMGLPRYYQKKMDYDPFLRYDSDRERSLVEDFTSRHSDFVADLNGAVSDGLEPSVADEIFKVEYEKWLHESDVQREKNLSSRSLKKGRGSL